MRTNTQTKIHSEEHKEHISLRPDLHLVKNKNVEEITGHSQENVQGILDGFKIPISKKGLLRRERRTEGEIRKIRKEISRITNFIFVRYNGKVNGHGGSLGVNSFTFENNFGILTEIQI